MFSVQSSRTLKVGEVADSGIGRLGSPDHNADCIGRLKATGVAVGKLVVL